MPNDTLKKLGRRIRELRRGRNLSQAKLAEKCNLSNNFIALLEGGKNAPSIGTLETLARVFGISISELFEFESDAQKLTERERVMRKLMKVKNMRDLRLIGEIAEVFRNDRT